MAYTKRIPVIFSDLCGTTEKCCCNCKHYVQHYVMQKTPFVERMEPIYQGDCFHPKTGRCRRVSALKKCDCFEAKEIKEFIVCLEAR